LIGLITNAELTGSLVNLKVTSPVASTTFTGGQQATITWQDDGLSPSLTSFGASLVGIYVGNANQQVSHGSKLHETVLLTLPDIAANYFEQC